MAAPATRTSTEQRPRPAKGVQTRVPWWGLLLPALGFALLLGLLMGGGEAAAAQHRTESPVLTFLAEVRDALLP